MQEEVLFLTQDEDFVEAAPDCKASIIWSRVSQSMAIDQRVEIWLNAVRQFFVKPWSENSLNYTTTDNFIPLRL
jgi:hypothetical protein